MGRKEVLDRGGRDRDGFVDSVVGDFLAFVEDFEEDVAVLVLLSNKGGECYSVWVKEGV